MCYSINFDRKTGNADVMLLLQGWFNGSIARYGTDSVVAMTLVKIPKKTVLPAFAVRYNRQHLNQPVSSFPIELGSDLVSRI